MLLKNKLIILLVGAALLAVFSYWRYDSRKQTYTQDQLFAWIEQGYSRQFCSVVFPNIANCVTATVEQCPQIVRNALAQCVANLKVGLGGRIAKGEAEDVYKRAAVCFEMNIHTNIMQEFLVQTQECIDLMS
jgi:hypothetical protein